MTAGGQTGPASAVTAEATLNRLRDLLPGSLRSLAGWLEGVLEVVVGDLAAEERPGLDGEAVVQARPDAGVVGIFLKVVGGCEVSRHREARRALDVDVQLIGPEEVREHLGDRRGDRGVRGWVLGVRARMGTRGGSASRRAGATRAARL